MTPDPANVTLFGRVEAVRAFCQKWGITEFALFGSATRSDFGPDSDVDVLVTFPPERRVDWSEWVAMEDELHDLFGRDIDLVDCGQLRNPFRKHAILTTRRVIYERQAGWRGTTVGYAGDRTE